MVYPQIPPARRRRLHRAIARALADPPPRVLADAGTRTWPLALGAEGPDAGVAEALDAAAASARSAAAPEAAAELAELARRLTPPGQERDRIRRTIHLAQCRFEAGDTTGARAELEALVAEMTAGPGRARVLLRLAKVLYLADSSPAGERCARQAIAEALPETAALAEAHALAAQLADHNNHDRDAHARQALEILGQLADPDPAVLLGALLALAMADYYMGRGVSRELLGRAAKLEEDLAERPPVAWRASTIMGQPHVASLAAASPGGAPLGQLTRPPVRIGLCRWATHGVNQMVNEEAGGADVPRGELRATIHAHAGYLEIEPEPRLKEEQQSR